MSKNWKCIEEDFHSLVKEWESIQSYLQACFEKRDLSNIEVQMKKGTEIFMKLLYLSNELFDEKIHSISFENLKFKPVNGEERLRFIISRPILYHSFIQLSEMILEQEKLFAKICIKKSV